MEQKEEEDPDENNADAENDTRITEQQQQFGLTASPVTTSELEGLAPVYTLWLFCTICDPTS